jgi:hypothetical protein
VIGQRPSTVYEQEWETFWPWPVSPISPIGYNAPTLAALIHQRTRAKTITSKSKLATAKATLLAAATTLIKAFKVITQFISTHADLKLY